MTVKGGTSQACAACKFQRRKCTADCPLAPYFPPDQPKQFQNAHRLFGVSNILKILKQVDPNQKLEAMRSIVYQSNMRDKYPVNGCLGIVCNLQFQIHQTQEELDAINTKLAIFRQHHDQISSPTPISSQLQLAPASNNALNLFHNNHHQQFNAGGFHSFFNNTESGSNSNNSNNLNQMWSQSSYPQSYNNNNNNNNSSAVESQFMVSHPATVATNGFDEMSTFLEGIDDRQSSVESKEGYESSSESSLKETTQSMEHVGENNLKSATTCLPFTDEQKGDFN